MDTSVVSHEGLRGMARMLGIEISDAKIDELLPQIRQAADSMSELDELVSGGAEPVVIFSTEQE